MRFFIIAATALALASCVTSAENTLLQTKRDSLRIDTVEVALAPNTSVDWPSAWHEYAVRKSEESGAAVPSGSPDEKQYANEKAVAIIQKSLNAKIPPQFRGSDPATLKVTLRQVVIPHAIQSILIGGDYTIKADLQLVDNKTGQVLINVENYNGYAAGPGGVVQVVTASFMKEPMERVANSFANSLAQWLKTGKAMAYGSQF